MLILTLESSLLAVLFVRSVTERQKNVNENVIILQKIIHALIALCNKNIKLTLTLGAAALNLT